MVGFVLITALTLLLTAAEEKEISGAATRATAAATGVNIPGSAISPPLEIVAPANSQAMTAETSGATTPTGIRGRFAHASEYFEFVQSIYPAATAGDRDAQYYLGEAVRFCVSGYRAYFSRGSMGTRTLDEAMQRAAVYFGLSSDEAQDLYNKCHALMEGDYKQFGSADEWIAESAKQGQPLAQVSLANTLLLQSTIAAETDGKPGPDSGGANLPEHTGSVAALALSAVKSKDPEVIWKIADLQQALTNSGDDAERQQWIWRVAACQRGFDCSEKAAWYEFMCRFDQYCRPGESGMDLIRRATGDDFYSVESMAKRLNSDIDNDRWSEIGFSDAEARTP